MRLLPKSREIGWTPYAWLIYLVPLFVDPVLSHSGPEKWLLTIGGVALFLPLYFLGYWVKGAKLAPIVVGITLLGVFFMTFNDAGGVYFIYAAAFAGELARPRIAGGAVALIALAALGEGLALGQHPFQVVWPVVFSALIGAMNIHYAEVRRANAKLRLAQEEVERLAKLAERERIARDLHDLLGHTLSLIVLKSELASKLAERDPARAKAEIEDVERISRQALSEVRTAVRGYRALGLHDQIDSATAMLRAAGVAVEVKVAPIAVGAKQEAVLALAVREAVTNVVRHAEATKVSIHLERNDDSILLRIQDDGRGGDDIEGVGLAGMRERIAQLGGAFERDGGRGTRLEIRLPGDDMADIVQIEGCGA